MEKRDLNSEAAGWLTGIQEVKLDKKFKMKNVEDTEVAKKRLLEAASEAAAGYVIFSWYHQKNKTLKCSYNCKNFVHFLNPNNIVVSYATTAGMTTKSACHVCTRASG